MLEKIINPLNVYVWIKINNYQAIAILWKQKKLQQASQKHNHKRTPNLTWKTLRCREKNHGAAPKNIYYNIEITTIKFVLNLSPQ